jgi:hypothetical protein
LHRSKIHPLKRSLRTAGLLLALGLTYSAVSTAGDENEKKKAAPPPPHNAAPAGHPGGFQAPHGPGGAPGGGAPHGPTTNAPHGPTTVAPGGGRPGGFGGPGGGAARGPTPSRTFAGHPTPAGGHEIHAANGAVIRTRADGSRADIHDARRGMDIHHGLNGSRVVVVERPDHSRVFAARGGFGYVQHPYMFHGHEFAQRTYWDHGHAYASFYGRYPYHGVYLEVYAPVRFYPVGFYGWAYNPWVRPVPYGWGWGGNPWYGYYGFYFQPYPVYAGPAFWLTDYLIATSLQASYAAQAQANANAAAAAAGGPPLSPDVKAQIADEVKYDVQQENLAAQANASNPQAPPPDTGVAALLSDGRPHVFVAGADLDVVDMSGRECMVTQGDVVQVQAPPPPDAVQANAIVLASKGGNECARSATVSVALTDLQEMQNHMRQTIDQGMAQLQAKQGTGGLPPAPPNDRGPPVDAGFATGAPPPDANAQAEITAQAGAADQAEREDASAAVAAGAGGAAPSGPPPTIALGQTTDQVISAIGQPTRIVDLGAKKIYTYPDMKITFMNGQVSDVQ